jgi:hypothetical protein
VVNSTLACFVALSVLFLSAPSRAQGGYYCKVGSATKGGSAGTLIIGALPNTTNVNAKVTTTVTGIPVTLTPSIENIDATEQTIKVGCVPGEKVPRNGTIRIAFARGYRTIIAADPIAECVVIYSCTASGQPAELHDPADFAVPQATAEK